jgi:hypothetical protein
MDHKRTLADKLNDWRSQWIRSMEWIMNKHYDCDSLRTSYMVLILGKQLDNTDTRFDI